MQRQLSPKPDASNGQAADWSELLPELLKPRKAPTMASLDTALMSVSDALIKGYISENDANVLLKHLVAAFVTIEFNGIMGELSFLSPERGTRNSWQEFDSDLLGDWGDFATGYKFDDR